MGEDVKVLKQPGDTSDRVFDWLSEAIVRGDMVPGEKVNEPKIAKLLSISRGPVREAVRRLEEKHLVVRTPQQGARVIMPTDKSVLELYTLREVLEGVVAREAARNISSEEADQLREFIQTEGEEPGKRSVKVPDFHIFIARAARNTLLFNLLCVDYYKLLLLYRRKYNLVFDRPVHVHEEHRRIAEAIIARDEAVAELLMRRHIADARVALVASLDAV